MKSEYHISNVRTYFVKSVLLLPKGAGKLLYLPTSFHKVPTDGALELPFLLGNLANLPPKERDTGTMTRRKHISSGFLNDRIELYYFFGG